MSTTITPWSPSSLRSWLARFEALTKEMHEHGDKQSLLVAAVMLGLRAAIALIGTGDERHLRALAETSFRLGEQRLEQEQKLEESTPS